MSLSGPNSTDRPPAAIANGRLGRIVRGYLGACFVASWGWPFGLILADIAAGHRISGRFADFGIVVGGLFVVLIIAAAPLATAAVIVMETRRRNPLWPYPGLGAGIGLVILLGAGLMTPAGAERAHWTLYLLAILIGGLAGVAYWVLAVRGTRPADIRPIDTRTE